MWPSLPRPSSTKSSATPRGPGRIRRPRRRAASSPRIRCIVPGGARGGGSGLVAPARSSSARRRAGRTARRSTRARRRAPVGLELGGAARRRVRVSMPPVSTIVPPRVACCASSEPTSSAGSPTTRSSGGVAMFMVARVRDRRRPRPGDRRSRVRPTRRRARAARRTPRPRRAGPRGPRRASRGRDRAPGRARSGRALRGRRRRPTRARGRARARAAARRRRSGASSAPRGRVLGRGGSSAAPRRAPSPRLRRARGREAAEVRRASAAACRPSSSGVQARTTSRSIWRARLAWISWPATARRSACATVAVRIGRRPRRRRIDSPSSGSPAKRARNSEWSSSRPSMKRTCSTPASLSAATRIDAVGRLARPARARAVRDRDRRAQQPVAHLARRVARMAAGEAERVGPAGESRAWTGSCRTRSILLTAADGVNERRSRMPRHAGKQFPSIRRSSLSPMLRRVASRVSMRSRERKLRLFLESFEPGPETTVDRRRRHGRAVRRRLVRQLLRGAATRGRSGSPPSGVTELDRFRAAFPAVAAVRADGRELPFADGEFDLAFSNAVVEHVGGGREGQRRFVHELCRVARRRVRDDAEQPLSARGALARPVRALAAARAARPDPAGARVRRRARAALAQGARVAVPLPGARPEPWDDLDRDRARSEHVACNRPVWALHVLIVGLALHNLVMAQLWHAGLRGSALSAVSAWKDVLLVGALAAVSLGSPRPAAGADRRRLAGARLRRVRRCCTASSRSRVLGGGATHKGVVFAARHDLLPVAAYLLGRGLDLTAEERSRLCRTVLFTAAGVAAYGLADVYLVPLSWWRHNGTVGWFRDQLGLALLEPAVGPAAELRLQRRRGRGLPPAHLDLPLAAGHGLPARGGALPRAASPPLWAARRAAAVRGAAVDAHPRRPARARAGPARDRRRCAGARGRSCSRSSSPRSGSRSSRSTRSSGRGRTSRRASCRPGAERQDLGPGVERCDERERRVDERASRQPARRHAHRHPPPVGLRPRQRGGHRVADARAGARPESRPTPSSVSRPGLLGGLLFVAWSLALLRRLAWLPWLAATFAAVLALGLQTDVIGIPWLAVVVWALAGDAASRSSCRARSPEPEAPADQPFRVVSHREPGRLERVPHLVVREEAELEVLAEMRDPVRRPRRGSASRRSRFGPDGRSARPARRRARPARPRARGAGSGPTPRASPRARAAGSRRRRRAGRAKRPPGRARRDRARSRSR